jgi:hypothetical protein
MKSLETRDWITLVASFLALMFSLLGYFQKNRETKQALRKQLTDTLKELSELNLKDATFRSLEDKKNYPPNYIGLLADQRRFFVRQAGGSA